MVSGRADGNALRLVSVCLLLRIVPEELWNAAHASLSATRETYLRSNNGRIWGRPPSGLASKYLLTGIARCGICGAGFEVRSRHVSGGKRAFYYSCSSYYRRGPAICPNRYEVPMLTGTQRLSRRS